MHAQIQYDWHPGNGCTPDKLRVAQQSSCTMMVRMQKSQGLFLEYQEDRVEELDIFDYVVDLLAARGVDISGNAPLDS